MVYRKKRVYRKRRPVRKYKKRVVRKRKATKRAHKSPRYVSGAFDEGALAMAARTARNVSALVRVAKTLGTVGSAAGAVGVAAFGLGKDLLTTFPSNTELADWAWNTGLEPFAVPGDLGVEQYVSPYNFLGALFG